MSKCYTVPMSKVQSTTALVTEATRAEERAAVSKAARPGSIPGWPVHYVQHPAGRRCYVFGRRLHHGLAGLIVCGAGLATRKRVIVALGAVLVADDWRDFPFRDCDNHNRRKRNHATT